MRDSTIKTNRWPYLGPLPTPMGYIPGPFVRVVIAAILTITGFSAASMEDEPKKHNIELAVLGGIQFGGGFDYSGGKAKLRAGPTAGGIFSWYVRGNGRLLLGYHYQFTELTLTPSTTTIPTSTFRAGVGYLQFGGEADFPMDALPIPFVGMTVGALHLSAAVPDGATDWFFAFGIYGGLKIPINKKMGIRASFKMLIDLPSGTSSAMCVDGRGCHVSVFVDPVLQGELAVGMYFSF